MYLSTSSTLLKDRRMTPTHELGLHLILIPRTGSMLPMETRDAISSSIHRIAYEHKLHCAAVHAREDHLHILTAVGGDADIPEFIGSLLDGLRRELRRTGAHMTGFEWDEGVHVTLLPPWHLEIMASFVRDQDRYHEHKTLENELDEVFRPNSAVGQATSTPTARTTESALCVN